MDLNRRTMFAASTFVAGCLLVPGVAEGAAGGTLRRGDSGAAVRDLQTRLTKLKYYVGNIDGSFGDLTFQGVLAIQKVAGLPRDGIVATKTWAAIDGGTKPTPRSGSGRAAEVDNARQVLLVVKDGVLLHTLNTSTGSGERYFSGGSWHTATTPSGTFKVSRQIDGWRHAELGDLWRPKYFNGGIAIHGSTSVPPVPASHGCCRVSITAMNHIWSTEVPLGATVLVY